MGLRLLIMAPGVLGEEGGSYPAEDWPQRLKEAVPGIRVSFCRSVGEADGADRRCGCRIWRYRARAI